MKNGKTDECFEAVLIIAAVGHECHASRYRNLLILYDPPLRPHRLAREKPRGSERVLRDTATSAGFHPGRAHRRLAATRSHRAEWRSGRILRCHRVRATWLSRSLDHLTGTRTDGEKTDVWVRATVCFRKIDGQWKVTHEHISVPFDMETFKASVHLKP